LDKKDMIVYHSPVKYRIYKFVIFRWIELLYIYLWYISEGLCMSVRRIQI